MVWIPVWLKKVQIPGLGHTKHIQNKMRDIMQALLFFLSNGARRLGFLFLFYFIVLLSLLIFILNSYFKNSY